MSAYDVLIERNISWIVLTCYDEPWTRLLCFQFPLHTGCVCKNLSKYCIYLLLCLARISINRIERHSPQVIKWRASYNLQWTQEPETSTCNDLPIGRENKSTFWLYCSSGSSDRFCWDRYKHGVRFARCCKWFYTFIMDALLWNHLLSGPITSFLPHHNSSGQDSSRGLPLHT